MEKRLRELVAPAFVALAACASFLVAGNAPIAFNQHLAWLRDISLLAAGGLLLSLGLRHMRRCGVTRMSLPLALAGLFVFGLLAALSLSALRFAESAIELLNGSDIQAIKQSAAAVISDSESDPKKRAWASQLRARLVFTQTGELMPVLDESGVESTYKPTDEDRDRWRTEQQLRVLLPQMKENARTFLYSVGVVALIALFFGLFTPVEPAPAV